MNSPRVENVPYISQIEMRGFKSFGNSKVSFPLSKGLTAIVGPNGTGKSNIVDGLCFVMGEMSAKMMRAERFSGLLFKGGNGLKPAPFAEVSIHFNNEDGRLPINSQTVVISRRVDRSGKCTCRINKRRANRQEIIDLLAAAMAGPGGYNFVMQGDVNRFVNMGALDRRLIIDDLAGVAEYDEKKQKSIEQLQKVETNLGTTDTLLREILGQMEGLRAQMETALRYKQLERDLEQTRAVLLLIKKEKYTKKLSQLKSKTDKLENEARALRSKHKAAIDEKNKYEEKINALEDLIEDKQSADVLREVESARTQINTLSELLEATDRNRSDIDQQVADLTEQMQKVAGPDNETLSAKFGSLSSKFETLHEKFNAISDSLRGSKSPAATRELLQKLRGILNELAPTIDGLSKCIVQLSQSPSVAQQEPSIANLRDKLIGLEGTRAELGRQLEDLKQKILVAESKLESASAAEKQIRSSIEALRREKDALRGKARGLGEKARGLEETVRGLDEKLQNLRMQKVSSEAELNSITDELKKIKIEVNLPADADPAALERRAQTLEEEKGSLGQVNFRAVQDFRATERRYNSEKLTYDKLVAEKQSLLDFMHDIDEKKKEVFMKTFNVISQHFSEVFSELSPGGTAELVLENEEVPFEGGLEIKTKPGGTEVSYVGELSGGQKALTALAFIFALQRYQPTTFYVLDEIDAHLDPQNRKRVAEMLRRFSRESQVLVITLHDTMMSVADRLFGVTKENAISRLFSVELSGLES